MPVTKSMSFEPKLSFAIHFSDVFFPVTGEFYLSVVSSVIGNVEPIFSGRQNVNCVYTQDGDLIFRRYLYRAQRISIVENPFVPGNNGALFEIFGKKFLEIT
ncbi:MAG: hypothetical protein WBD87_04560 [Candidatus Acidiferrales bacterium]